MALLTNIEQADLEQAGIETLLKLHKTISDYFLVKLSKVFPFKSD